MSYTRLFVLLSLLLSALLIACQPAPGEPGAGEQDMTQTPEAGAPAAVSAAALAALAGQLGISADEIEIVSVENTEFSDACLGLGGPEESCAQVITPGWLLMLSAGGRTYEAHTDETGTQVRIAGDGSGTGEVDAITASAAAALADQLGLSPDEIEVVSAEMTEFSDSCLGLGGAAESCLQAVTPGWIVLLNAGGQSYEVHTDVTGTQVRIAGDGSGTGEVDAITASAAAVLADQLGLSPDEIEVVSAEMTEFSDGCLELGGPEESCLQALTPGWLVMLSVGGQEYEAHTDVTGTHVRIAGMP